LLIVAWYLFLKLNELFSQGRDDRAALAAYGRTNRRKNFHWQ